MPCTTPLSIAMLSIHSSPIGRLGTKNTGGMSVHIRELSRQLAASGHRIDIFTRRRSEDPHGILHLSRGVRLIHLDIGKKGDSPKGALYRYMDDFFHALEGFRCRDNRHYDLVHSHYWLSGPVGERARKRWHVPHVIQFHSLGMIKRTVLGKRQGAETRIFVEKALARNVNRVIVPTNKEFQNLIQAYDAPAETLTVIPCGVNRKRFRPQDKDAARQRLKIQKQKALLLYVGRFTPEKCLDRLLEAAAHLKRQAFKHSLLIVGGDGPEADTTKRLKSLAHELGIQDWVGFAGTVANRELPTYYNAADLVVLPSLYESFGLVILEALACGTPVVSTAVGATEHLRRRNGKGLILVKSGTEALVQGLRKALSKFYPENRFRYAISESMQPFDWPEVGAAVSGLYIQMLQSAMACPPTYFRGTKTPMSKRAIQRAFQ